MSSKNRWLERLRELMELGATEMATRISKMSDEALGASMAMWADAITSREALVPSDDRDVAEGVADRPSGGRRTAGPRPKRASRKPGKRRPRAAAAPRVDPAG